MTDYELKDIRTELIEPSDTLPVVIDFWAPWCGPCKTLGPVLEKLAAKANGRWKFVKVNVDEQQNQQLAAQFQIRSIPAVRMLYQGKIVASFEGSLPESQVKEWLRKNLPEVETAEEEEKNPTETIEQYIEAGDRTKALEMAKAAYEGDRNSDELKIQLAMLLLPDDAQTALKLLESTTEAAKYELEKESIATIILLKETAQNGQSPDPESKHTGAWVNASKALHNREFETAIEGFINIMMADRAFADDGARKACIAIFKMLDERHPVTQGWRRRFSMALY